ncbi:MAG: spore coat-associated protein [Thermoleophilaceae bacterium]|nr:spore coat-associated protein [Thermoleophilaceae bacterium]
MTTRLSALMHHPMRTLGALAAVLLATGVAVGSGANFTAQTSNPSNLFTAGALTMSNSKDAAAILTASGMLPGAAATVGTVDIGNTGTVAGAFTLSRPALTDTPASPGLSNKLNVVVKDCGSPASPDCSGGATIYSGTLAAMTGSYVLGSYAPGASHRYQFSVALDSSAGNTYQAGSAQATFQWDAASS